MPTEGCDYSSDRPDPWRLYAAGKRFACRYVGAPAYSKHLTPAEAQTLTYNGMSIVCVNEGDKGDIFAGRYTGVSHARAAMRDASVAGMPDTRPIYFAFDVEPTAPQRLRALDYFFAVRDFIGSNRIGIYGGYDAIEWAHTHRIASWFWQTAAWSRGIWHPSAHIRQYRNNVLFNGAKIDLDVAMTDDYGQWVVGDQIVAPAPAGSGSGDTSTPWLYTDHIDNLANAMSGVGDNVYSSALAIERLSH